MDNEARPSLRQAFAADPLLRWGYLAGAILVLVPLFVTPFLPLRDLCGHVALASMIVHAREGTVSGEYYYLQAVPVPYWASYAVLALGTALGSPPLGSKLLVALIVLTMPLGVTRLAIALRRSPRVGLAAFPFAWDYAVQWGFLGHALGVCVMFFLLARAIEARDWKDAVKAWPLAVVLALTHAHPVGMALVFAVALAPVGANVVRRLGLHLLTVSGVFITLLPWVLVSLKNRPGGETGMKAHGWFEFWALSEKFKLFYEKALGLLVMSPWEKAFVVVTIALAVITPIAFFFLPKRDGAGDIRARGVWCFALIATGLYWIGPWQMHWPITQGELFTRQVMPMMMAWLLVATPRLDGKAAWVLALPATGTVLFMSALTATFASFATRAAPFQEIIDSVRDESRVISYHFDEFDPAIYKAPYTGFGSYILAKHGGYYPYLWDVDTSPVRFKKHIPHPHFGAANTARIENVGRLYDYVLVQGKQRDPFQDGKVYGDKKLVKVKEAGRWRLYEVVPAS